MDIKENKMKKRDNELYKHLCVVLVSLLMIMIFLYFHEARKHLEISNNEEGVGNESTEDDEELQRYMTTVGNESAENDEELQKYMTNNTLASSQNAFYAIKKDGTVITTNNEIDLSAWNDIVGITASNDYVVAIKKDGTVIASIEIPGIEKWRDIIDISASESYLAGLKADGTVVTSGTSEYTKGKIEDTSEWNNIIQISQGLESLVALKSDGTVVGTGSNYYGQLEINNWKNIIQVETKDCYTAGLRSDGTVVCVGYSDCICDTSRWKDIVEISVDRWGIVGLKSDGTLVATGAGLSGSGVISYDNSSIETQLSINGITDVVFVDSYFNTICIKKDGTAVAVGSFNTDGQSKVELWNDLVNYQNKNDYIEKIGKQEIVYFDDSNEMSQAEKFKREYAEKKTREEEERINKEADIHIGMDSKSVLIKLEQMLNNNQITVSDSTPSGMINYSFTISNIEAADLFKVDSVRNLPQITNVTLQFLDDKLEYIDLKTELPLEVSNSSTRKEYIANIIKNEAKKMGYDEDIIIRGQYGSSVVYRGTFEIDGAKITLFISDELKSMDVRLYSNF